MATRKTSAQAREETQPGKAGRHNKRVGIPEGRPSDYSAMRVYPGNKVGLGGFLIELLWDEWKDRTWDQLGEYIRAKPGIGNREIHVKCLGGRVKTQWFAPKKTMRAAVGADGNIPQEEFAAQQRTIWELEKEIEVLRAGGNLQTQLRKILKGGITAANQHLVQDLLDKEYEEEEDDDDVDDIDDEPELLTPIAQAFVDLKQAIGDQRYTALLDAGTNWLIEKVFSPNPMQQQPQHTQHAAPQPAQPSPGIQDPAPAQGVEDEFLDLPYELEEFLETIDFSPGATNPQTLINAVRMYAAQLGVVFKKG